MRLLRQWLPRLAAVPLALVLPLASLAPVDAAAGPLTITADMPAAVPAGHNWGFDDFFPRALTVNRGSTIQFAIEGFHTATLLPPTVSVATDLNHSGVARTDGDDTARNPNGTTHIGLRIAAIAPQPATCGTAARPCTFNGLSTVSSGVPNGPAPWVVRVTAAPGLYVFHCRIHPAMTATLRVVPRGAPSTTPAQLATRVAAQVAGDVSAGRAAEAAHDHATGIQNANGTTTWLMYAGAETPGNHVVILEFLPRNLRIRPGDRVAWLVTGPSEPHTVTFPTELNTDMLPLCEHGAVDTPATPLHVPPQGPTDFSCGGKPLSEVEFGGGNGVHTVSSAATVADSGLLLAPLAGSFFRVPASAVLSRYAIRFTGPAGTYHYLCQIHQGMEANIVVH
ncbi:MAG TPA: hypothetical protein VIH37_09040 [Candidatus Limnocylindrales bacterium]